MPIDTPTFTPSKMSLSWRFLALGGKRTSLALEPVYWTAIDTLASRRRVPWLEWIQWRLADQPVGISRASYLRQVILTEVLNDTHTLDT